MLTGGLYILRTRLTEAGYRVTLAPLIILFLHEVAGRNSGRLIDNSFSLLPPFIMSISSRYAGQELVAEV